MNLMPSFRLVHDRSATASVSPYRILDTNDRPVHWINDFLDAQHIRGLSLRSLRASAPLR